MTTLATVPAIETPQLILREIEPRDAVNFARFMTQPAYQRHIAIRLRNRSDVDAFVRRAMSKRGDGGRCSFHLAAEEKMSGEAIGDGFILLQRPGIAEIGWGVHPAMWAMGVGTEIGRALLALSFERLDVARAWCKVMSRNVASLRLARRIGLKHLKSHPDYPTGAGQFEPVEIFQLTAQQYFEAPY
jgi:[ribosomal protein S5]-alanine N-acetyltransferase